MFRLRVAVAVAAVFAALPASASAAPALSGTFTPTGQPGQITTGPDGAAWFTLSGSTANKEFARIASDGTITEFDTPGAQAVSALATAGGSIWLGFNNGVIKVDPAAPNAGVATASGGTINGDPQDMAADGAGNVWVVDNDGLVRVNTAAGPTFDNFIAGTGGREIALGGDGRMWWADFLGNAIQATTTAGVTTKATDLTSGPQGIAAGPGTQMAFGQPNNLVGRISPGAAPLFTTDTGGDWGFGIVFAQDGAYWSPRFPKDSVGRLTPDGGYTTPISLPAASGPRRIAAGANNTLWVTLELSKQIARISGVDPAPVANPGGGGGTTTTPKDTTKPRLAKLKINVAKRRFAVTLSEAASLRVTIDKRTIGKRKGKKCRAAKKGRTGKKCVRYVKVRSFRKAGKVGKNTVSMGKKLKPARYRLSLAAVDAAGNRSATAKKSFTVKKPKKKSRKRKK